MVVDYGSLSGHLRMRLIMLIVCFDPSQYCLIVSPQLFTSPSDLVKASLIFALLTLSSNFLWKGVHIGMHVTF